MDLEVSKMIYTGFKFFGLKIYIESTGDKEVDKAIRSTFKDDYCKTAPLSMSRADVQMVLEWSRKQE